MTSPNPSDTFPNSTIDPNKLSHSGDLGLEQPASLQRGPLQEGIYPTPSDVSTLPGETEATPTDASALAGTTETTPTDASAGADNDTPRGSKRGLWIAGTAGAVGAVGLLVVAVLFSGKGGSDNEQSAPAPNVATSSTPSGELTPPSVAPSTAGNTPTSIASSAESAPKSPDPANRKAPKEPTAIPYTQGFVPTADTYRTLYGNLDYAITNNKPEAFAYSGVLPIGTAYPSIMNILQRYQENGTTNKSQGDFSHCIRDNDVNVDPTDPYQATIYMHPGSEADFSRADTYFATVVKLKHMNVTLPDGTTVDIVVVDTFGKSSTIDNLTWGTGFPKR